MSHLIRHMVLLPSVPAGPSHLDPGHAHHGLVGRGRDDPPVGRVLLAELVVEPQEVGEAAEDNRLPGKGQRNDYIKDTVVLFEFR